MARAAGALCGLLGLLSCLRGYAPAPPAATVGAPPPSVHSLRVNIAITPKMQPWCEAEVVVDGQRCFSYDCQSDVRPICVQGKKVEATHREQLRGDLKDLAEMFKEKLLATKPKDSRGSRPLSLQATMVIQEEASGRSQGSWQFVISGQISLNLDLVTGNWTVDRPRDRWMLEKWKDRNMNATLWRISHGDWKKWLQHVAAHWETLETTAPPSTTPGTTPGRSGTTSTTPGTSSGTSRATSIMQGSWFIFVIILAYLIHLASYAL